MSQSFMTRRNFFLPTLVWDALKEKAVQKQLTVSELIRQILKEHLDIK